MKKSTWVVLAMCFSMAVSFAQSADYQKLLEGYIQNNQLVTELQLKLKKEQLALQKVKLGISPDISLSTGSLTASFSENSTTLTASPSATLSLPALNGTKITAQTPIATSGSAQDDRKVSVSGAGISASVDIVSSAKKKLEVSIMQAERQVLEAERNLNAAQLKLEREFLQKIKTLYSYNADLINASNTLNDEQGSLYALTVQGFAKTSTKYRTGELKVKTAERNVQEKSLLLQQELSSFGLSCGFKLAEIPELIAEVELVDISSFSKEEYASLEQKLWSNTINNLQRSASSDFALRANAGYKYSEKPLPLGKTEDVHTIETGLSATYKSVTIQAGVSLPVQSAQAAKNPSLNLSLTWNLNSGRTSTLDSQSSQIDTQLEKLAVTSEEKNYESNLVSLAQKRADLLWAKVANEKQFALYADYLNDMEQWHAKGMVSESEYNQAKREYTQALFTVMNGRIDRKIYNLDIQLLFTNDL